MTTNEDTAVLAQEEPPRLRMTTAAWAVHLFTASGAVAGLLAVLAIIDHRWQWSFIWMTVATVIDSVDGALARAAKVKHVLPGFDGALLDNIADYFTYVAVPAVLLYEAGLAPPGFCLAAAVLMMLSSAYQFCQGDAKTHDHYFKGFPSYWNVTVFYLFTLGWNAWVNAAIVGVLAVLVFVPIKYVYPSRTEFARPLTVMLTIIWAAVLGYVLVRLPDNPREVAAASLAYVVYYFGLSFYLNIRRAPACAAEG